MLARGMPCNRRTTGHNVAAVSSCLPQGMRRWWPEAEAQPVTLLVQPLLAQPLSAQPLSHASRPPAAESIPFCAAAAAAGHAHLAVRSTRQLVSSHQVKLPPIGACAGHQASPAYPHAASLSDATGSPTGVLAVVIAAVVTATMELRAPVKASSAATARGAVWRPPASSPIAACAGLARTLAAKRQSSRSRVAATAPSRVCAGCGWRVGLIAEVFRWTKPRSRQTNLDVHFWLQ